MEGFSLQINDLVEVAILSFETLFELYPKVMTSRLMIILMMMTIKIKTMIRVPIINCITKGSYNDDDAVFDNVDAYLDVR